MRGSSLAFPGALVAAAVLAVCNAAAAQSHPASTDVADRVRSLERQRLRALVQADTAVAETLHADDFQLVNPLGETLTRTEYLGGIASGELDYILWEPDEMSVRVYGNAAVLRYRSKLEIVVDGEKIPERAYWHTDLYEEREGGWQVVWSQATMIR